VLPSPCPEPTTRRSAAGIRTALRDPFDTSQGKKHQAGTPFACPTRVQGDRRQSASSHTSTVEGTGGARRPVGARASTHGVFAKGPPALARHLGRPETKAARGDQPRRKVGFRKSAGDAPPACLRPSSPPTRDPGFRAAVVSSRGALGNAKIMSAPRHEACACRDSTIAKERASI